MTKKRPSKKHQWGKGQIPVLDDHGAAKHEILSEYIQKYLSIVCNRFGMGKFDITLVDGFAGGGIYEEGKIGSPFVMVEAVNKAIIDINKDRKNPIAINPHYFFIEKDPDNFESLENNLSGNQHTKDIYPLKGDFVSYVDMIISAVKKQNPRGGGGVIFFLDQEGYTSVSIKTINKIRRELPQSEIILTLAISWLIDYISDYDGLIKNTSKLGLTTHLNVHEIVHIKENVIDSRNIIESKISHAIRESAAFPFFRPFFIEPRDNHRGYWLLHLSPHHRAHNAMTETIWKKGNHMRHYGGAGTRLFDLYFKGEYKDIPSLFGKTFVQEVWEEHRNALIADLPRIIWRDDTMSVEDLIIKTCNETAAPPKMYMEALSKLQNSREIIISGKSGGKKRGGEILPSDRIGPQRQRSIF